MNAAADPLAKARIALAAKCQRDRDASAAASADANAASALNPEKPPIPKMGYRIEELVLVSGLSKNTIRRAIARGEIRATIIGQTPVIPLSEVRRLFG